MEVMFNGDKSHVETISDESVATLGLKVIKKKILIPGAWVLTNKHTGEREWQAPYEKEVSEAIGSFQEVEVTGKKARLYKNGAITWIYGYKAHT